MNKPTAQVWILMHGELSEGGHIVSVHSLLGDALNAAELFMRRRNDGEMWHGEDETSYHWTLGCEWVTVQKYDIQ